MIVGTERCLREADGPVSMARGQYPQCAHARKGGRPWVHLERTGEPVRSPKIRSVEMDSVDTVGMKNAEESKPDNTKNWHYERKHFEILVSEISMKCKN